MNTKKIIRIALCASLLIGVQLAFSGISGIELVTLLLLSFSFSLGHREGVAIATVFSILRCLIFGFYINIVVLYIVYYNLFALFFGWLGKRFSYTLSFKKTVVVIIFSVLFTALFTLADDIITPLIFGFSKTATIAYFFASLYTLIPQAICTLITTGVLFVPLTKVLLKIKSLS